MSEWFHKALAAIAPADDAIGFDRISIRPSPVGDLTWVRASHESVPGRSVSEWTREAGRFVLTVRIPTGATATVFLLADDRAGIMESGTPAERAEGGRNCFAIGSGDYRFASALELKGRGR